MDENKILIEEVALKLGVSVHTIELWYRWKKANRTHVLAELLPDFERQGRRRLWKESDIEQLKVFQNSKPHGPGGLFTDYTYKYHKYKHKEN